MAAIRLPLAAAVHLAGALPGNVGAMGLEFANPRRQHESTALRKCKPPDQLILIPGVIDPKSNFVEHPEVVAQRIETLVRAWEG